MTEDEYLESRRILLDDWLKGLDVALNKPSLAVREYVETRLRLEIVRAFMAGSVYATKKESKE